MTLNVTLKKALFIWLMSSFVSSVSAAEKLATKKDIDQIRHELKMLVETYEAKIFALEQRLQDAEEISDENTEIAEQLAIEISQQGNQQAVNTYNPGIGVILNGIFLSTDSTKPFSIPGFALGEETGPADEGFSLGESEMNLTANIDDKFYASVTLAFGEGVEVEEAFIETIAMTAGLKIKAGRFFSNIGYLANKHVHTDNFSSRPLAYEAFLGGQYGDDGIQLTWLASTDIFWESGIELYRGDTFPAAGADSNVFSNKGTGVWTVFTHLGDDINESQSWRLGLSYLDASVENRETELGESFNGDSNLWIADFVWKWAPNGNSTINNATIQAEYLHRNEKGLFTSQGSSTHLLDSNQQGWYVQGIYQFKPQWRFGLRYSQLSADNLITEFNQSTLDNLKHDPSRTSLMIDWSNSEFSRLRLQYSRDNSQVEMSNIWSLQYIAAFGAHGGHSF